jgi:hypothetical protein
LFSAAIHLFIAATPGGCRVPFSHRATVQEVQTIRHALIKDEMGNPASALGIASTSYE